MSNNIVISIDPGKYKCGILSANIDTKQVLEAKVVSSDLVLDILNIWLNNFKEFNIIIGNGTTSKYWIDKIKVLNQKIIIVDESNSTIRAKQRFYDIYPPKGIMKLFPIDLFVMNKNLDSLASLILLEDYYNFQFKWNIKFSFKVLQKS
tara:strand:- start:406 stop:852 length:447 start_codon:yes stop_codon:yes gene_type:complete